jgi:glc operon protein GlcG
MLTLIQAENICNKALLKAEELTTPVSIVILDFGGRVVLSKRMDNASYLTLEVAQNKATISANFKTPTHMMAEIAKKVPDIKESINIIPGQAILLPGGFPIMQDGICIGAIGVAGGDFDTDKAIAEAGVA